MGTEQLGKCFLLGITQFWEFLGHVRDRAVVLADLHTVTDPASRRRESGGRECPGDGIGGGFETFCTLVSCRGHVSDDGLDTAPGEVGDRSVSPNLPKLAHGGTSEVVIGVTEPAATLRRDLEVLGGSSASAMARTGCGNLARFARFEQCVEMASHTRGAQAQPRSDLRCGDGALLEEEFHHSRTRAAFMAARNG